MTSIQSEVKYDDTTTLPDNYKPIIYKLEINDKKNYDISPTLSQSIDYPLFSLGFQQYLHANVEKMELTKEFEGKKKVYNVMNLFEATINDYDTGIEAVSKEYFKLDSKSNILDNNFYKLWEIITMFDIVPINSESFSSVFIADENYAGTQAISLYRQSFSKKSTQKDKYFVIETSQNEKQTKAVDDFKESLGKNLKVYGSDKYAYDTKTIQTVTKDTSGKTDLVIANSHYLWQSKVTQEQELLKLLIGEVLTMMKVLGDDGNFICKLHETFTKTTCKLIYTVATCFKETYIIKPLTSRASESEKFLVCIGYKVKEKLLSQYEKLVKLITENSKMNVIDMFPELILGQDFNDSMTKMNVEISNKQIIGINKIISFIKKQNYYGDEYSDGRIEQIKASTYWTNLYYPNKGEYSKMTSILNKIKSIVLTSK